MLKVELGKEKRKIQKRNDQLRANFRELWKGKKRLERSEKCFFLDTYNMMVQKAHAAGLDHMLLLLEGLDDPIGQEEVPDEPLVVSLDSDEDLLE